MPAFGEVVEERDAKNTQINDHTPVHAARDRMGYRREEDHDISQ